MGLTDNVHHYKKHQQIEAHRHAGENRQLFESARTTRVRPQTLSLAIEIMQVEVQQLPPPLSTGDFSSFMERSLPADGAGN